jgi:hypothetical protein
VYAGMFVYPWDLVDEGIETVAERLRVAGVNTIVVAGSYHAGKFLRPHAPRSRVLFPDDGTVYFRPSAARYRDTPLRPIMNRLVEEHDLFAVLSSRRHETGLDVAAWMVALHNTRLGTAHPEYAVRNAYGDPYYYNLCPSHPEVRAYLVSLLADFTSTYDVQYVDVETAGYLPYPHGFHHEFGLVPPDPWSGLLLALCFCPACARDAAGRGLDGGRIAASVRLALDDFHGHAGLPHPSDTQGISWFLTDLLRDADLAAYLRMRIERVTALVRELRAIIPASARLSVIPSINQPLGLAWLEGADLSRLAEAADIVEICAYLTDPAQVAADIWWARRLVGPRAALHVVLRPAYPDAPDEGNFQSKVRAVREFGADGIAFYNYGHFRIGHLAWVRRALAGLDIPGAG